MKTLGLIGGLSWHSTAVYYRLINQQISEALGGSNSAKILLYSVNFDDFKILMDAGNWGQIETLLTEIAQRLENAGADCIVICTNTSHLVADGVRKNLNIPLLHIAEETAKEIKKNKVKKVALLGTKFTMENSFFRDRLSSFGIDSIIPNSEDRDFIHTSVFNELALGIFKPETRKRYLEIFEKLKNEGAEGLIFGCTEISLLINESDCKTTIFDTTAIHARAAVAFAIE